MQIEAGAKTNSSKEQVAIATQPSPKRGVGSTSKSSLPSGGQIQPTRSKGRAKSATTNLASAAASALDSIVDPLTQQGNDVAGPSASSCKRTPRVLRENLGGTSLQRAPTNGAGTVNDKPLPVPLAPSPKKVKPTKPRKDARSKPQQKRGSSSTAAGSESAPQKAAAQVPPTAVSGSASGLDSAQAVGSAIGVPSKSTGSPTSPMSLSSADTMRLYDALAATNPDPCLASAQEACSQVECPVAVQGKAFSPNVPSSAPSDFVRIMRSPESAFRGTRRPSFREELILALLVAVTLFLILTIVLITAANGSQRRHKTFCATEDCQSHAFLLNDALNRSVDACEDFMAHVCSKWSLPETRKQLRDLDTSTMNDMVYSWLFGISATLQEGSVKFPVGRKALAMFESCMSQLSEYGSTLHDFRVFLKQRELPWPGSSPEHTDALRVLITLGYNWQASLWFSLRVVMKHGKWNIVLTPAPRLPFYLRYHQSVKSAGSYVAYWTQYYHVFTGGPAAASEKRAIEAQKLEGEILEALNEALAASTKDPSVFPIGEIEMHTPSIKSSRWLWQLQNATSLKPALTGQDEMVVSNERFLLTIGELFGNYTNEEILAFLAWQFVQHYAPVADSRLLLTRYGDQEKVNLLRPAFCGLHVEVAYKVLLLTLYFSSRVTESESRLVDVAFKRLVSTTLRLVNSTEWLDPESKAAASAKIGSVRMLLWPPPQFLTNESLEHIYQSFPAKAPSFGGYWIESIRSMRTTNRTPEYEAVLNLPLNYAQPYFEYDYVENTVGVAIGAVARPLFYGKGTTAMLYGGLGFSVAVELVKAIDRKGLHWRPDGGLTASIFSKPSLAAFDAKEDCMKTATRDASRSVFPEIPAVQVAYSAFLDATKDVGRTPPISEQLTEAKVFFITLCYMTCSRAGTEDAFSANCNKVVRNSLAFANAFECPPGSKMNPVNKCTYFD